MDKKIHRTKIECINMLLIYLVIFSGLCFLLHAINKDDIVVLNMCIYMLIPISFIVQYAILNNLKAYIIVHFLSIIIMILLCKELESKLILGIALFICMSISINKKKMNIENQPSTWGYYPMLVIVFFKILSDTYASYWSGVYISVAFLLYIILFKYNEYLVESYRFLSSTTLECRKTFYKKKSYINTLWRRMVVILAPILLLVSLFPQSKLFSYIWYMIRSIIACIYNLFNKSDTKIVIPRPEPIVTMKPTIDNKEQQDIKTDVEVDTRVFIILFIVIGIFFVLTIMYSIYKNKKTKLNITEEIVEEDESIIEKVTTIPKKKMVIDSKFKNTKKQQIRKIFFKTIINNIDEDMHINKSCTPEELCSITQETVDKSKIEDMCYIYEKARYSNEDISDEDYKKMKDLRKEI